jgi:hypothetical protein
VRHSIIAPANQLSMNYFVASSTARIWCLEQRCRKDGVVRSLVAGNYCDCTNVTRSHFDG